MKRVWKWIMHLNAKAFCLIAVLLFLGTAGWCVHQINTPLEPIKDGTGKLPDAPEPWTIGILDFVTNQLAGEDLSIPITPFGWTMEQILANPGIKDNPRGPQFPGGGNRPNITGTGGPGRGGPGGPGRGGPGGGGAAGAGEPKMIIPRITFLGFIKDQNGDRVACFMDSSNNKMTSYSLDKLQGKAGNERPKDVHGIEIISADMKEAQVKYPDGSVKTIPVGGAIELAEEPETPGVTPKPAAKPAAPKARG